jgi:ribulose-5-phosphate 4-epimerase/fuculose-1-phosphate aldolase
MFVYHDTAYHEWEGVAINLDERERLVADLGNKHLMILRNHGTLALGGSVASCFMRMYYLERACRIQVDTLAGGGEPHMPSSDAVNMMESTFSDPQTWEGLATQSWPAMRRLAERIGPGYRD